MAKPKTCSLCNATELQEHQPWCIQRADSYTEEFQASIIEADQTTKRRAWYAAGGRVLAKAVTWGPGFTLDQYIDEVEHARDFRLWEEVWFKTYPDAEGYSIDDIPVYLRPVQVDSTDEARGLPRGPNGLADWSKPDKIYPPYDGIPVTE